MLKKINIIVIILGCLVIYYFVNDFGLEKIIDNLKQSGPQLIYILLLWALIYILNAIVLKVIIGKDNGSLKFSEMLGITISAYSINLVTPFVSLGGEPYKILAMQDKLGTKKATAATLLYTILHMLAHTFFWLLGFVIAFIFFKYSKLEMFILILLLSLVFFLVWFFFSRLRKGVVRSFTNLIKKIKFLKSVNSKIAKHNEKIDEIDLLIIDLYKNRQTDFWIALSVEFFSRLLTSFEIYIVLQAVSVNINFAEAVYITAAFTLIMNLIFFVPMELGTRESSLYFLVKGLYSVDGVGVYVAIISRIREVFWILMGIILIQIRGIKYSFKNKEAD